MVPREAFIRVALDDVKAELEKLHGEPDPCHTLPAKAPADPQGEIWSAPMKKCDIMRKLEIDSYKKLTSCCRAGTYQIQPAGKGTNRELWQIRLDTLDARQQAKFGYK